MAANQQRIDLAVAELERLWANHSKLWRSAKKGTALEAAQQLVDEWDEDAHGPLHEAVAMWELRGNTIDQHAMRRSLLRQFGLGAKEASAAAMVWTTIPRPLRRRLSRVIEDAGGWHNATHPKTGRLDQAIKAAMARRAKRKSARKKN